MVTTKPNEEISFALPLHWETFHCRCALRCCRRAVKEQSAAVNEVQILAALDSPFVVRYYDSFLDENCLNIVMEYCPGGDLNKKLKAKTLHYALHMPHAPCNTPPP